MIDVAVARAVLMVVLVAHERQFEWSILVQLQLDVFIQIVDGKVRTKIIERDPRLSLFFLHHTSGRCLTPVIVNHIATAGLQCMESIFRMKVFSAATPLVMLLAH